MLTAGGNAKAVTKVGDKQFHEKKLTAKVVAPAGELASPVAFLYAPPKPLTHARESDQPTP